MNFLNSLKTHRNDGRALLAANFYNVETLLAILRAARQTKSEVILQTSPSTLEYLGVELAAAMARAAARENGVRAWLHLDHASDPKLINACIEAGYDSVMIDASDCDLETNIERTRAVVETAHARGVAVEAELGVVPKLGQAAAQKGDYTTPETAAHFVRETHIDFLAVAIGSAHGFYKSAPRLDLERLEAIRDAVEVPLVLHGGSGLSAQQWQSTIERGVAKINFATEIKDTFTRVLQSTLCAGDEIDLRKTFPPAMQAVTQLVVEKMRVCAMTNDRSHA